MGDLSTRLCDPGSVPRSPLSQVELDMLPALAKDSR